MVEISKNNTFLGQYNDSGELYELLFDRSPYPIFTLDAEDSRVVKCNQAAADLFERDIFDMLGLHQSDYVVSEENNRQDEQGIDKKFIEFASGSLGSNIKNHEIKIRTKTGKIKSILVNADLCIFCGKKYIQATMTDITISKKSEGKLQEHQRQIEYILGATNTCLDILDSNLVLRYVDPVWAKKYGSWEGRKCYEYFMGSDVPCSSCGALKAFETKQVAVTEETLVKEGNRIIQVTTTPYQSSDGEWLVAEVNVDITEHKDSERALQESHERLELALQNGNMGIWDWYPQTRLVEYDKSWSRMLGFQPEEVVPNVDFFKQLVHPTDLPDVISRLMEHVEGRSSTYKSEHRLRNKSGEWIWVLDQGNANAWDKNGIATRVSGVAVNINERKIKEREVHELSVQAQEANRAKSEFLATMSHEIRTPLNAISGFTQLLGLNENLSADDREYINRVLTSTEGLLKIINSVLDLSKVEAGKVEIEIAPYPLTALLDDVAILKSHAMKRGIELKICNSAAPGFDEINIDTLRLKQCLVNVVGNSIKFTRDNGFVSLVSSFEEQDDKRIFVRFDIIDNGIGIAADKIGRIFEPFMQADSSTTRKFGGTGLGLPFTKKIVELMGGSVDVHSEENEYTIFTLKVPTHLDKETFNKKIKLETTYSRIT